MRILRSFRVHHNRDPEKELGNLQHRFRAISDRADRGARMHRLSHKISVPAMGAFAMLMLYLGITSTSGWPPLVSLKHLAAFPNCTAARAVGLAPANRGDPGYWPSHDRDKDGKACEPLQR